MKKDKKKEWKNDPKKEQLKENYVDHTKQTMTTNEGVPIANDHFSLKAGERGPSLFQDFQMHEKLMHFDRERIPERVVHARGSGAHGYFECYDDFSDLTAAKVFSKKGKKTPVFTRFSTVQGSRGSADTVRDVRGFAVKMYTEDGNLDLVGISTPVFFVQDAIKFPDFIHSVKPEPKNEVPQGQSAHDGFWDFVSTNREACHQVFWAMSDRGIPRSYRTMEGFGVHTFKWVNKKGDFVFVKYHFKPVLGVQSLVWDEALKISGNDPDFHRKDLWDAIEAGNYPEYELCVQVLKTEDEFAFDFDILDPTKLWPEELVPLTKVGKIVLNRNPENFFAETEQVAFSPGNIVPGIDFSDDPLLQGRIFAYPDAHVYRLGGPNFQDLPINRPVNPVYNNQRDGFMQNRIPVNETNYDRNNRENNDPKTEEDKTMMAFHQQQETFDGKKMRGRIKAFTDFYTQPRLFLNSLSETERKHLTEAFEFELSKVKSVDVRRNVLDMLDHVSPDLAAEVGAYLGIKSYKAGKYNYEDTGESDLLDYGYRGKHVDKSPALSQDFLEKSIRGLKVAVLLDHKKLSKEVSSLLTALEKAGLQVVLIANELGMVKDTSGKEREIEETYHSATSVLYDGLLFASVQQVDASQMPKFKGFLEDAFNHYKPLLIVPGQEEALEEEKRNEAGVCLVTKGSEAVAAMEPIRYFERKLS